VFSKENRFIAGQKSAIVEFCACKRLEISMKISAFTLLISVLICLQPALGNSKEAFVGKLEFTKKGCETTRDCILKGRLLYRDPDGLEWQADKGNLTDGASIPSLAQPFVGKPFDKLFIRAAVIHDHYCDRTVRSWWATHRVFYNALRFSGVPENKAKVMYLAVVVGGPKWITLIEGKPCGSGQFCANAVPRTARYNRESQYDDPTFEKKILPKAQEIMTNPELSLDDIDKAALAISPEDFFLSRGDSMFLEFGTPEYFELQQLFEQKLPQRFDNFKIENK
jgi:hypothetical protein